MRKLLDLIFPRRCPVCDRIVPKYGMLVCPDCEKQIVPMGEPWCTKCGKKMAGKGTLCEECSRREHSFDRGRCAFEYSGISMAIYRFKYGGRREYAEYFGKRTASCLEEFLRETEAECLIPVPLHKSRQRARGYNQAAEFAKALSRHCGIPIEEHAVKRCKKTVPLKFLDPLQRQNNLRKAFILSKNDVKWKSIIIIDDIYTTGATIDEIASMLKEVGVGRVFFVTLSGGTGI